MMQAIYRTTTPLPAVAMRDDGKRAIVQVPERTTLVLRSTREQTGLVEVEADGRLLRVFAVDLAERAERAC